MRGHVVSLTAGGQAAPQRRCRAAPLIDTTAKRRATVRWRIRHRARKERTLSQEFERQACLQSRRGRLNDDQEREAKTKSMIY